MQQGRRALKISAIQVGDYQEVRIRQFHKIHDEYLRRWARSIL